MSQTSKEYGRKQDAVRAARKEFGEGWESSVEVIQRDNGKFIYDFPRNGDQALQVIDSAQALLAKAAEEIKVKKAKKAELLKGKPVHVPATPEIAQDQGAIKSDSKESSDEGESISKEPLVEGNGHMEAGDKAANLAAANLDPLKPRLSTAEKPTKLVWAIADELTESNPKIKRSEVIAECVNRGIAYGTARTQYQHWFKQKAVSAAEPRAQVINGRVQAAGSTAKH